MAQQNEQVGTADFAHCDVITAITHSLMHSALPALPRQSYVPRSLIPSIHIALVLNSWILCISIVTPPTLPIARYIYSCIRAIKIKRIYIMRHGDTGMSYHLMTGVALLVGKTDAFIQQE